MKSILYVLVTILIALLVVLPAGCGKKAEESAKDESAATTTAEADEVESLPTEAVPFAPEIQAGGFDVVYYQPYLAGADAAGGKMLLYRSNAGGKEGGMVYVEQLGPNFEWVWHWYFEDVQPKTIERIELNEDGLWDIRITTSDGTRLDLIQDKTFTLAGGERRDKIALNGKCSEPVEGHPLWHCFDGSTSTAWKSSMEGDKPFIEVASPLGLKDGILSIRLLAFDQPKSCEIEADGKTVQSFQLEATTEEQLIQLDSKCKTAKKIKLTVRSCHGASRTAAIAELSIR